MAYSSPEEGLSDGGEHLAEHYGTPPIRHTLAAGRLDKFAGPKKLRKLPSHVELSRREKQGRRSRHMTKCERQKERLDARAFKELDTTLQVLGIDGSNDSTSHRVTASPHAPLLPAGKQKRPDTDSAPLEAAFASRLSVDSSGSLLDYERLKDRYRSQSLTEQRRSSSFLALPRVSNRSDSLEDERQKWHAGLDSLLQGNLDSDDLQVALSLASSKASDLKEQLIYWQTPPDATWPAMEERIEWLHQAMLQLKDITTGLQQHGISWKESDHIKLYLDAIKEAVLEMEGMAAMCCDAIAEGLQGVKEGPQEMRRAFRAACRVVTIIIPTAEKQRHFHAIDPQGGWAGSIARLGQSCVKVVHAMMEATTDMQESLLQSAALSVTLGKEVSGHEVSDRCKQLQFAWQQCADLQGIVSTCWRGQANNLNCAWCRMLLEATRLANEMQRNLPWCEGHLSCILGATSSGLSDDSVGSYFPTGVWGPSTASAAREVSGGVSDEELQAQAWLPACLTILLANAEKAGTAALGCEEPQEGEGDSGCEDWRACQGLVEELSDALYELALTGTHRVGSMCLSPSGLACWALELLEEQACQAVVFVRDLDRSVLGRGEHGLVHYETLRKATDTVVNAILTVRRLLKQKRAADHEEDGFPRPLPVIRSDSQSSLTSALQHSAAKAVPARQRAGSREAKASAGKAPESGRPPLTNGHAHDVATSSQAGRRQTASPLRGRSHQSSGGSAQEDEAPVGTGRRHKSRHAHGSATPPIPEDSDGETERGVETRHPAANGLDYREDRDGRHRGKRHKHHRRHRHGRQRDRSPEEARCDSDSERPASRAGAHRGEALDGPFPMDDPFAQPEVQHPQPGGLLPLAVFSSSPSLHSSNSLVPAGSSQLFRFGSFSTSPTQSSGALLSPRAPATPGPRGSQLSPFAGITVPPSAFTFARSGSQNSSNGQPGTPTLEGRPSQLPAELRTAEPGLPIQQGWHSSAARETPEWAGHPMSDPTNGYHHPLHYAPALARRVSGEALKRQGSSESSTTSSSSRSGSASGRNSRGISIEGQDSQGTAPSTSTGSSGAFKLPWEGDPFWQIRWEELKPTLVRKIGSGSFGQVYEAYYHCAPMAVKILQLDGDVTALPDALLRFKQEVDLQRRLSFYPYIVRFVGACCHIPDAPPGHGSAYHTSNVTLAIVMELCRLGTLFKLIEWARKVSKLPPEVLSGATPPRSQEEQKLKASPGFRLYSSWQLRLELAKHAAAAVEYMHSQNILHRDLTSYNLLVTDKFEAKVADFNLSRAMKGMEMVPTSGVVNSPEWAAPERLSGQAYGRSSDVFSYGVILWELITLAWPWHETDGDQGRSLSSEEERPQGVPGAENGVPEPDATHRQPRDPFYVVLQNVTRGDRLEFPPDTQIKPHLTQLPQLIELAKACWRQSPVERPTMTEVCLELDVILDAVKRQAREERRHRQPGP